MFRFCVAKTQREYFTAQTIRKNNKNGQITSARSYARQPE
jgi:hypothetical protein